MSTAAPYPPDTRAKGWRFELDIEKVKISETWLRARTGAMRGALLLLWSEAWHQSPCGSLPNDDELIALLIDMPAATFGRHREVLMRGWWLADDGRLYHTTVTERVLEMISRRRKEAGRKAARRAQTPIEDPPTPTGVPDVSRGTPNGLHRESDTGTGTGRQGIPNTASSYELARAFRNEKPPALTLVGPPPEPKTGPPECPHGAVLALWADVLPAMPQHNRRQWRGQREDHLRCRWRESAVEHGWGSAEDGMAFFRRLFAFVGQSEFLTGRSRQHGDRRPFVIELEWLVKPANWAKVIEGKYHPEEATA